MPYCLSLFSFTQLNSSGVTTIQQKVQVIQELPGGLWFPEKSRLQVQAEVIERATGNTATVVDTSCQFTSSPYLIQFKDTAKYFKPGLRFVVKVWTDCTVFLVSFFQFENSSNYEQ